MVGTSTYKWSSDESTNFSKASPLQLSDQETKERVCARVFARACVCVEGACVRGEGGGRVAGRIPIFPRFEHSLTPGREMGRRRWPPRDLLFPRRGVTNSGRELAASNPGWQTVRASAKRGDPGLPTLTPIERRHLVPGMGLARADLRSGARGPEGEIYPCGR